jgi:hypothetical protein
VYTAGAVDLGKALVERGLSLVYGGGNMGLMKVIADTVLVGGGHVTGVIPEALIAREGDHKGLSEQITVKTMHERKALMAGRADAFVAMPGGFGTLEELFEAITWLQLGIQAKPVAVLNLDGFYDPLLAMIDHAHVQGFISNENRQLLISGDTPASVLDQLEAFDATSHRGKWSGLQP